MSGHYLKLAVKFEKENKKRRGISQGRTPSESPKGRPGKSGLQTLTKKKPERRGLRLFPLGLAPFNKKERRPPPPPPLPSFSPEAREQTLNYNLKVLLFLAGSGVGNPESILPEAQPVARTLARSPDRSILTSGAGALFQAPTLPSSSRSPAFSTAAPGLPAAEYFRTSTHPEPFENFVCA